MLEWIGGQYRSLLRLASIDFRPPLLYSLTFIFLFCIGGLTGLMQGALAVNVHIHDTYFIVGHFHYVIFGGTGMAFFAALLFWFPKMFGKMYNEKVANYSLFPIFIGFNMLYFTMLSMGYRGMPRRYYDHLEVYHTSHVIASVGSFILVAGLLLLIGNFIVALFRGKRAEKNPWRSLMNTWTSSDGYRPIIPSTARIASPWSWR